MKNDKEFLEGIYKKAEVLEREKYKKNRVFNNFIKYSSVAAIFIILPLLLFNNQISKPNNIDTPIQPRIMNVMDPMTNFYEAEYILIGTTEKIDKDNITICIDEVLYGDISTDEIIIDVSNGVIADAFIIEEKNLLFLNKDDKFYLTLGIDSIFKETNNGVFEDSFGNEYNLKEVKNNIDRR